MPELIITGEDFKFQFMTNHLDYIFTEILRNSLRSTIRKFVEVNNITDFSSMSNLAPPPVFVEVTNTKTEMTFKFSDQGGGVPLDKIDSIWSFGKNPEMARKYLDNFYKLPGLDLPERLPIVEHQYFKKRDEHRKYAPRKIAGVLDNLGKMEVASVEQGKSMLRSLASRPYAYTLGVSLPMCKVYTDYWNGTLNMCTMEGYGSDVFLKLQKLGNQEGKLQLDKA
jgi:pyruvate dehydrogenase kinase 2/3/4